MIVDVYVKEADEAFIDDIDEIKEDSSVEIFIIHPKDETALAQVQQTAAQTMGLFYCAPLSLMQQCDGKCLAYYLDDPALLNEKIFSPLYIDADMLTPELQQQLIDQNHKGIILNATGLHEDLSNFYIAIGPGNISAFDLSVLANISMDRIALQSAYPEHDFEDIFESVKTISSVLFRPEESIIARATRHSLSLFGLK